MTNLHDQAFDDITNLAALICDTSIALVSFVENGQQQFMSRHGIGNGNTDLAADVFEQTLSRPDELFVVPDMNDDERFSTSLHEIDGSQIRFYAGAALVDSNGEAIGALCVVDQNPHELTEKQENALRALSRQVVAQRELRDAVDELQNNTAQLRDYQSQLEDYQRQLEMTNARLRTMSVTDDLTGLSNRFAFEEELRVEFERATQSGSQLSLMLIDADHFKSFNDEFGHPAGDDALRSIANFLKESLRLSDFVARIGGEEFVVVLPGTPCDSAWVLAERCRKTMETVQWPHRPITISIGISSLDGRKIDKDTLIREADQALYHSKTSGRNCVTRASDLVSQRPLAYTT